MSTKNTIGTSKRKRAQCDEGIKKGRDSQTQKHRFTDATKIRILPEKTGK